jgi:uncharacterized protein (DUF362 family)
MKTLLGAVWDRGIWHRTNLQKCIAEFPFYRKPDLNIVDAYRVMYRNGPRGVSKNDVMLKRMQIIGTDMVSVDSAAMKILGQKRVPYIKMAESLGIGVEDLTKLNIRRITL